MELIVLKELKKIYGEEESKIYALRDFTATISEGELVAVVGTSGSGKSTLLNIIGLIDKPTNGDYFLDGKKVNELSNRELAMLRSKKIGFVFQNFNLLYDYTVGDNVAIPLKYAKVKKGDIKKRVVEILKILGIENHIDKTPDKLSGGERQRVAIARALINNPDIILADEPTGALDKNTGKDVIELLKQINKQGKTVIIITHDESIANECQRTIHIEDGKVKRQL